ncbi:MAG: exodeoxyribonuclease VII small subunit [Acidobacteriota bacterium]|nr:MAG: exodeoxyribonuclease VII small subunit [Acidobacteriota bacterium]
MTTEKRKKPEQPADPSAASFEQSIQRLEQIVSALERGELNLDESLKLFEEGVSLSRRLDSRLSDAEMKVEQLLGDETVGFDVPDASKAEEEED